MIKAMKRLSTLAGAAALAAGMAFAPQAHANACPPTPAPYVSVQVFDPGAKVSTIKSLDQINAMAGSHGLLSDGFRALGLTHIDVQSGFRFEATGAVAGQNVCVNVSKVEATFGLQHHTIYIPREYRQGSCQYKVVMRHERAHVDVNRRMVRKYAAIMKNEVRSMLRQAGPVAARSMKEGQALLGKRLQALLDRIAADFRAEREALHGAIDDPNSTYAARNQCPSW